MSSLKNIYFIQAGLNYGKSVYLPYATGCLAAYAMANDTIRKEYRIAGFIYRREEPQKVLDKIIDPDVVAFSCYNWTAQYNNVLTQLIKEKYPGCVIIYGGHNVPDREDLLAVRPLVDYLIHGEGEVPFSKILLALSGEINVEDIENISYRNSEGKTVKTASFYYESVESYPSPYLSGTFDEIIAAEPDTVFCGISETNRGCPYNCAYCDWCFTPKIRKFPFEKIVAEVEWMAARRVEYIFCADSNFGILKRDLDIAKAVTEIRRRTGYPHIFGACYAKNSNDTVFEISRLFYDNKLNKAATLAYQTLSPTVLKNVNRENFTMDAFSEIAKRYNSAGIPTYTEMILGLPGETYESFCSGLCCLIEAGQQSSLTVYSCQVYCNSLLGDKEYRKKHGVKTVTVPMNHLHSSEPEAKEITEYVELVTETATMPREMMVKSLLFSTILQSFHHMGLLKFIAVYLHEEKGIGYYDFYNALLDFAFESDGTLLNEIMVKIRDIANDCTTGEWTYTNHKFGEIGWFLEEGLFLELVADYERFSAEILPFIRKWNIDSEIEKHLISYQKFVIRLPEQETVTGDFEYDFYHYFKGIFSFNPCALEKRRNRITVSIPNPVYNLEDYATKVVLYAKRRGDTIITSAERDLTIELK